MPRFFVFLAFSLQKMPENLGKNSIISYLLIAVVIKYSLLKMAAAIMAETGSRSGPKPAVFSTLLQCGWSM